VEALAALLRELPTPSDPALMIGVEHFSDAGIYRLTDEIALVQTLDFFPPGVDDPFTFGQIAAANSLSDVYAMGGTPKTAMNIVGFPDKQLPMSVLGEILKGGAERVHAAGAVVLGGHSVRDSEIKFGLSVTGIVHPDRMMNNESAQPGDVLVLTKALGTGFISSAMKKGQAPDDAIAAATASMTELNRAASEAAMALGVKASTDITGFGLAGHAAEMAEGSGVTIELHLDHLPLIDGAMAMHKQGFTSGANASNLSFLSDRVQVAGHAVDHDHLPFIYDPQTSGGLLLTIAEDRADALLRELRQRGNTVAAVIGRVDGKSDADLVVL
jgi:selenide,water dikinase